MQTALITGGSRGFGKVLATHLACEGWDVTITGRTHSFLQTAARDIPGATVIAGDVADPAHRARIAETIGDGLDLLVNNASDLGPSPLVGLDAISTGAVSRIFEVNVVAPIALIQALLPKIPARTGTIVNMSSDAAVTPYPGWGGYGASKAALDHITAILAAEHPHTAIYAFDPGDMQTDMHQAAFVGEDISDRPLPHTVVPALMRLLTNRPMSGRYLATDLLVEVAQ